MQFLTHKKHIVIASEILTQKRTKREKLSTESQRLLLSLMGNVALAGKSGLQIDPTVGISEAQDCIELAENLGLTISYLPIALDSEVLAKMCEISSREFFKSKSDKHAIILAKNDSYIGNPFPENEAQAFDNELKRIGECQHIDDMWKIADELLLNNDLRGNKFLAGMAFDSARKYLGESRFVSPHAKKLKKKWSHLSLENQRVLMSEMINGFRQFLFFNLGGAASSAYPCNDQVFLEKLKKLGDIPLTTVIAQALDNDQFKNPALISEEKQPCIDFSSVGSFMLAQAISRSVDYKNLLWFAKEEGINEKLEDYVDAAQRSLLRTKSKGNEDLLMNINELITEEKGTPKGLLIKKADNLMNIAAKFVTNTGVILILAPDFVTIPNENIEEVKQSCKTIGAYLASGGILTSTADFLHNKFFVEKTSLSMAIQTLTEYTNNTNPGDYLVTEHFKIAMER